MSQIEKTLQKDTVQAFDQLFGHSLKAEDIQFQPTRKDFEGTHTLVVFPFLKVSQKNPEETGKMIGEFLVRERVYGTSAL